MDKAGTAHESSILVTGGNGRLATELKKILPCTGIDMEDCDITDTDAVRIFFAAHTPDTLIHCAAYTNVSRAEVEKAECYQVNVLGTENLVRNFRGKKFVYLSTDYVFDGSQGNYSEDDLPNPLNYYALTKLLGEMVVRQYPNTLIIRTSFKPDGAWPYPAAFTDLWTSAEYVRDIAPEIALACAAPDIFGVLHIGGSRKSIYDLARRSNPIVGKRSVTDADVNLPRDVSLDSTRWKAIRARLAASGHGFPQ